MGRTFTAALIAALLLFDTSAIANVVEWDSAEAVELQVSVEPREHAKICSKLTKKQAVDWSFRSSQTVNFSIYYYEGSNTLYPVRRYKMLRMEGTLEPKADQTYCWTWVNEREFAVTVNVALSPRS